MSSRQRETPAETEERGRGLTLPVRWESNLCSPPPALSFGFSLPTPCLVAPPTPLPAVLPSQHLSADCLGFLVPIRPHRSMFPSNAAFILSLPWQLPISPKESAGSVFPWRWHGDIARQLWTACWDSAPFLLSSSHPDLHSVFLFARPFAPHPRSLHLFEGCVCTLHVSAWQMENSPAYMAVCMCSVSP